MLLEDRTAGDYDMLSTFDSAEASACCNAARIIINQITSYLNVELQTVISNCYSKEPLQNRSGSVFCLTLLEVRFDKGHQTSALFHSMLFAAYHY